MTPIISPTHPLTPCPTQLSSEQVEAYRRDGFVAFTNVLTTDEVKEARAAMSELIQRLLPRRSEAKSGEGNGPHSAAYIQSTDSKFFIQFEQGCDPVKEDVAGLEMQVRKLMCFHKQHATFEHISLNHPRVQGIIESILGANPILIQDMALIKPPRIGREKPWHQDDAYFSIAPLDSVIGVWIALDDAKAENGCMHVLPGRQKIGPLQHHHTFDCEIVGGKLDTSDAVAVELPAGGAIFFHGLLPHETPPNRSEHRRRALQFHYRGADSRILDKAEYDRVFVGSDGTPASCASARKKT